jgi:hypothetical protein
MARPQLALRARGPRCGRRSSDRARGLGEVARYMGAEHTVCNGGGMAKTAAAGGGPGPRSSLPPGGGGVVGGG